MTMVIDGTNGVQFPDNSIQTGAIGRNRIINGAMLIDQRNAGASVSATHNLYTLDRWAAASYVNGTGAVTGKFTVQQNAGSVTPPVGFTKYLGVTSSAATTATSNDLFAINQPIEGLNGTDLAWGTANAQSITLSFWVRSSVSGTFGGCIRNSANGVYNYPFTYTISVTNTWEYKTITIPGATGGTWDYTNGAFIQPYFQLQTGSVYTASAGSWTTSNVYGANGCVNLLATNGATLYITGVQLEKGSSSPFEYRQYGTELALCQRYYQTESSQARFCYMRTATDNWRHIHIDFKVQMRATPTWSASLTAGAASSDYQTNMSADAYRYYANTSTADYVTTWTASAEL